MSHLSNYFRRRRLEKKLPLSHLAAAAGYRNISKGCSRIDQLEKRGRIHPDLLGKLAAVLGIDPEMVEHLIEQDRRCFFEEWNKWVNERITPFLLIRLIPAIYRREFLSESITTVEEAEAHAGEVARHWKRYVCLVWTRKLSVWIDEKGEIYSRTEARPNYPNEPLMRLKGCKRAFTFDDQQVVRQVTWPQNRGPNGSKEE